MLSMASVLTMLSLLSLVRPAPAAADNRQTSNKNGLASNGQVMVASAHLVNDSLGMEAIFTFQGFFNGTPTFVTVNGLRGFYDNEADGAPFKYHVHTNPLSPDGNCASAFGHLDPLNVSESIICDPAFPQFCQLGDISGKHGKINGTDEGLQEKIGYSDDFLRWFPEELSLLGRSVVIHANNSTRLACANITSTVDGTLRNGKPTNSGSDFVHDFPSSAPTAPMPVITPLVGTELPDQDVLDNLPLIFPQAALPISKAQFVVLTETHNNNGLIVPTMASFEPANDAEKHNADDSDEECDDDDGDEGLPYCDDDEEYGNSGEDRGGESRSGITVGALSSVSAAHRSAHRDIAGCLLRLGLVGWGLFLGQISSWE